MTNPAIMEKSRNRFATPLILLITFAIMTAWTWNTWPDAIYDFGSQLYYPWQITTGKTLYLDIAYFNGPLSQYFNALMFAIFGVSLRTLVWVNLAILLGVVVLIYHMLSTMSGRLTATVGCLVFLLVFAFSQYVGIGNYNWVCPYTHEVTHGVALSLAAIAAVGRFHRTSRTRWLWMAGLLLGLTFLTKAEVSAPAVGAVGVGMLATGHIRRLSIIIVSAIAPVAAALLLLSLKMPIALAGRAVLGSWLWVFDTRIAHLQFYRQGLGTDDIVGNIGRLLMVGTIYAVFLFAGFLAAKLSSSFRWLSLLIVAALVLTLRLSWQFIPQIARPWPLFVLLIAIMSAVRIWKRKGSPAEHERLMLAVLALGLLGKMLLNARIVHYGFALAMPAALLLTEALLNQAPRWVEARGGNASLARWVAMVLLGTVVGIHLYACHLFMAGKTVRVGTGNDQFLAGARGAEVELARQAINRHFPIHATLAVMPQGLMLNYLTRHTNPTPFVNLMPPEMLSAGEDHMLAALVAKPPDIIVLARRDLGESGFLFPEGRYEYGRQILAWVKMNYQPIGSLNLPPSVEPELGLLFLTRK